MSEGRSQDLTYFVFDLLFEGADDLRQMPLTERKERLRKMLSRKGPHASHIKYVEHLSEPGDAVLKSACNLNLEGIISKRAERAIPVRPHRDLAQVQMPRRPGGGDRRLERQLQ